MIVYLSARKMVCSRTGCCGRNYHALDVYFHFFMLWSATSRICSFYLLYILY